MMKKRVGVGALIFLVVVAMFFARAIPVVGLYVFDIFLGALAILCSIEMSKILNNMNLKHYSIVLGVYPTLMYVGHMVSILAGASILVYVLVQLLILLAVFACTYIYSLSSLKQQALFTTLKLDTTYNKFAFKKSGMTMIGALYPSLFLLFLMLANRFDSFTNVFPVVEKYEGYLSLIVLLFSFLIPMVTDTFSMIFGSLIGGAKLCPKLSPNKTVSGAVSGFIWSSIVSILVYYVLTLFPTLNDIFMVTGLKMSTFALLGMVGSVASQLGDLFESFLKRKADMKDSGTFLQGHGGFLDRLDSHIFNAPVVFVFFLLII